MQGAQHGHGPTGLTVADDSRFAGVRVQLCNLFHEGRKGCLHIRHGLAGNRIRCKQNKIDRVPLAQRHADLGILFESPDARSAAGTRIEDNHGPDAGWFPGRAFGQPAFFPAWLPGGNVGFAAVMDAGQPVIGGRIECLAIHHNGIIEGQNRRHALLVVHKVVVAALP